MNFAQKPGTNPGQSYFALLVNFLIIINMLPVKPAIVPRIRPIKAPRINKCIIAPAKV
jgi:hypothetical protein